MLYVYDFYNVQIQKVLKTQGEMGGTLCPKHPKTCYTVIKDW